MAAREDVEALTIEEKPTTVQDLDDLPPTLAEKRRIRYVDDIEGMGAPLARRNSTYSIHSIRSTRARSIDPTLALPIQYRTLSYNIEDRQQKPPRPPRKRDAHSTEAVADLDWHIISESEVCKRLDVDVTSGLRDNQVQEAQSKYGKNMPTKPPSHGLQKLFWYFFGGFGSILLIGGILVFISWKPLGEPNPAQANLALAIVLLIVFVIQALFNMWQDFSSSRVMNSITGMLPEECHVTRNGVPRTIQAVDVVPGDVLHFKAGNKLPADVRFIEVSTNTRFDRSILTGESVPLAAVIESTDLNYLETRNIGMQGTHCTSGSGIGVVVSTGDNTVFGHIAKLTSTPSTGRTPLQKEIIRFVILIVALMITMNIIVLGVWAGYIRTKYPDFLPVNALIVTVVSVAIAFVPEGLPIALTASLTITANIMKKNNILCKSLKTVETLGSVSVLLSDKTGTLTKNLMTVTDVLVGSTARHTDDARRCFAEEQPARLVVNQLRIVAGLCNAGEFDPTTLHLPLSDRKVIADATDAAILRFSELLAPVRQVRDVFKLHFDLAFNSKNKFAIRVFSPLDESAAAQVMSEKEREEFSLADDLILTIKGAPDVLLPKCSSTVDDNGNLQSLDSRALMRIESIKDEWSAQGKRVLLLARKILGRRNLLCDPSDGSFEEEALRHANEDLILVGLLGIVDPPRDEVPGVVDTLQNAGIRVMMVTGDYKLTAQAIARSCGIITVPDGQIHGIDALPRDVPLSSKESSTADPARQALVLSGSELATLNDTQWSMLTTYQSIVFARTTPDQKLRIVREFQARANNVVAMTGDGVNDAPALKQADIGIAPGTASDIALEAADMVLLDSFGAITEAVLYGRTVFDNLRKLIAYLLPAGSFSEFWPVMTSVVFGLPQILSSFLMIIICCFTDCAVAITLAFEKPEADVLLRPPRNIKKDRLVDWRLLLQSFGFIGTLECASSFAVSYWYLQRNGIAFSNLWFNYGDYSIIPNQTPDQITAHLSTASSIYFVNLVIMQWFSVLALRTRRLSITQHPPLFNSRTQNWSIFPAILFAFLIIWIFCYIPALQRVIGSTAVPVEYWFLPMAFGLVLLGLDELRKWGVRRYKGGILDKMAW